MSYAIRYTEPKMPTLPENPYKRFAQEENDLLNRVLSSYFRRPITEDDAKNVTLVFRQKDSNGFDKYDTYDIVYKDKVIGVIKKQILFGKFKIKFTPSKKS